MEINYKTNLYGLIGNPINKTLSPIIHNYSFNHNDINSIYLAFNVKEEDLENVIKNFTALNINGINVTIPYKETIIKYLDELDEEAQLMGAVNTVKVEGNKLKGYNTDGRGFIETLKENNVYIRNKRVLLLGAGGAARGIGFSLCKEGINELIIANRTVDKAEKLVNEIVSNFINVNVEFTKLEDISGKDNYDLVINCTSVGMDPYIDNCPLDPRLLNKYTVVYDIVYKPLMTKFLKLAKENGNKIITGIDMLIYQALISEEIWLNKNLDKVMLKNVIKKRIL